MRFVPTSLPGFTVVEPTVHADARGFFVETFREDAARDAGIDLAWVQDNHARSQRGVLRGMHFSVDPGQAKLVRCARGRVLDVVVDVRPGSPTFGRWEGVELDDENGRQVFVPVGFAHGYLVLSEVADVVYKCTEYYDPSKERGIAWDDPDVGIEWPAGPKTVSERDATAPRLAEISADLPFAYAPA